MKISVIIAIIGVLVVTLLLLFFFKKDDPTLPTDTSKTTTMTPTPSAAPAVKAPTEADAVSANQVILKTTKGDITLNLFPADAPLAVKNFVTLGKSGYYNGVIFHRVIAGFMDQAGDPTGTGSGGESIYGKPFKTEINDHKFLKGVLGVANSGMDTNGSQFFIMAADYPSLNGGYTAMGQVADSASQTVVDEINKVPVNSSDKPLEDVKITGFQIVK